MRFGVCGLVLASIIALSLPGIASASAPMAAEDLFKLSFVSDPRISPDGKRIVFMVSS